MKINKDLVKKYAFIAVGVIVAIVILFIGIVNGKDKFEEVIQTTEKESASSNKPNLTEEQRIVENETMQEEEEVLEFEPITNMNEEVVEQQNTENADSWAGETEDSGSTPNEDIYYNQDLEYDAIFQNARLIDIGYNINQYKFELIDATPSYLLFLANPEVLILHHVQTGENFEIDTHVQGASISDDEQFLVYYKNSYEGSQAYYFNLVNKKSPVGINKIDNGDFGDIQMIEGSIYMTYNEFDNEYKYSMISYPMINANYEIPEEGNVKFGKIGKDLYIDKKGQLLFFNEAAKALSTIKVGEIGKHVIDTKDMKNVTSVSENVYEGGDVFSIISSNLYVNGKETEYKDVSSMTYHDGKLYFANDVFLYSYDGKKFTEHQIHRYVDKVVGSNGSLYITTLENEIYKLK